jgi:hypothetical protein
MAQMQYPPTLHVPPSPAGKTITFTFTGGVFVPGSTNAVVFDQNGGGTYTSNLGSPAGTVIGYIWVQDAYRGRLRPIGFSGMPQMTLHLDFDSPTAGTFKGLVFGSFPESGTFTATP